MGSHWIQFESALNTAAKNISKEPHFEIVPDQRNTLYEIRHGDRRQTIDVSEAEQLLADSSKLEEFVGQFLN